MPIPKLTKKTIRENASASSFERGESYYYDGAVTDLTQRGNLLQAQVEGSDPVPYRVSVKFSDRGITSATCTCPYDFGGWCKHIVAALLTCLDNPQSVEIRPPVEELLNQLNLQQTRELIKEITNDYPDLLADIDRYITLMNVEVPSDEPKTSAKRKAKIDISPITGQVKRIIREGIRALEYGYEEEDIIGEDILKLVAKAEAFTAQGDGNSAVTILDAITDSCAKSWSEVAEYGLDDGQIGEHLDQAWTEAILCAELTANEKSHLREMLEEWQDELDADFAMSITALEQGWNYAPLQAILQGQKSSRSMWGEKRPAFADDLALARLRFLEKQGRTDEYLRLAEAEELTDVYLSKMATSGQLNQAMVAAQAQLKNADEAFAFAQTLQAQQKLSEALQIAQLGLSLSGHQVFDLANWTSELAESLGDRPTALKALIQAFKIQPSLESYIKAQDLADSNQAKVKADLLKNLAQQQHWHVRDTKIRIYIHEGMISEAIAVSDAQKEYGSTGLLAKLMDAAIPHQPQWVIKQACSLAEPIMSAAKSDRYAEAVSWLQKAKAAYLQMKKHQEWSNYYLQLTTTHSKKRKLMELFRRDL